MQSAAQEENALSAAEGEDGGDGEREDGWPGVSEAGLRKPSGWVSAWHYLLLTGGLRVQEHLLS